MQQDQIDLSDDELLKRASRFDLGRYLIQELAGYAWGVFLERVAGGLWIVRAESRYANMPVYFNAERPMWRHGFGKVFMSPNVALECFNRWVEEGNQR